MRETERLLIATTMQEAFMAKQTEAREQVENELVEIALALTAMGDMVAILLTDYEDMEPETPRGIKILLLEIRKRIENLREYIGSNCRQSKAES